MTDTYNAAKLLADLRNDEGFMPKPYRDTVGNTSIGIGRNLTGNGLSEDEIMFLYNNDISTVTHELSLSLPWWTAEPANIQRVLINLAFNMGIHGLLQFTTFLSLLKSGDYQSAATDLEGTLWYKQVASRGPRMIARILTPDVPPIPEPPVSPSSTGA